MIPKPLYCRYCGELIGSKFVDSNNESKQFGEHGNPFDCITYLREKISELRRQNTSLENTIRKKTK